ncbi:MAG TPA: DUF2844 domain-containing protein [Nitrospirota bacterium]|nr:DUF2844 domain-containing protein [Nitrospirota bacterium]
MKRTHYALVVSMILLTAVLVTARPVHAVLGESADSVTADRKALSAMRSITTTHVNYTVQQVESDSVTVREYISSSGIVFAVAWSGLVNPDLTQLLGSYSSEYREAQRQTPRTPGKRAQQVKTKRVVVETWGHMRHLQGRAYAPTLVPQGVTIDEIK